MSEPAQRDAALVTAVARIGEQVAREHADDVDRAARFPSETLDALRAERVLSAFVPEALGGAGVSFGALAQACLALGRCCGASAMILAMHQIQVVTIARHSEPGSWFDGYLRSLAQEQRLIASVTSEVGTGGDMARSIAALSPSEDGLTFEKRAPTVSYGAHADDLLTTLRRDPEAEPGDQVLALTSAAQTELEPMGTWDPLGMRGTCSPGFTVRGRLPAEQVLAAPFSRVMGESMVPVSHILWSHVWLGIASDAFERARASVRAAARATPGQAPPSANRLSHLMTELSLLRAEVASALSFYVELADEPGRERLGTMAAALRFNNLKVASSEQAPRVCQGAMAVCGIAGYRNDTPYSVGRHLRDAMSAALMVANERLHQTNAGLLLIAKEV